mgnify:CR=1 FL=1
MQQYQAVSTFQPFEIEDIATHKKNSLLDYALTNEKEVKLPKSDELDWLDDSEESIYAGGESFDDASGIGGESFDNPEYEAEIPEDLRYTSDYQWFPPISSIRNNLSFLNREQPKVNPSDAYTSRENLFGEHLTGGRRGGVGSSPY